MNSQSSTLIGSLARAFLDNSDHSVRRQQLRTALWIRLFAIVIVCVIGLVAEFWLGVNLPWPVFAGVILVFIALNALAAWRYQSEARVGRFEVAAHLGADLLSFSVLLYFTGGVTNPFVSFYLPLIGLAAALLPRGQVFVLAVVSVLAYSFLMSNYWPLVLSNPSDGIHFHLIGMWMNFMVSVLILVVFVARLSASVRQREHDLRQAQGLLVRESKLAVLGNQAASIAHQLGTPAATLVTILADWVEDSALQAYSDDVWVMQNQLQSIQKTLAQLRAQVEFNVGVRGSNGWVSVNPQTWLDGFVQQWRNRNPHAQLKLCVTGIVPTLMPLPIDVLELALTNILDNAVQSVVRANKASPLVLLHVQIDQGVWAAQVEDEGGGIPLHILGKLGQQPMPSSAFGHGMGLFLVCGMLERLEGRLSFSNTLQGAKVQLQLPLSLLS